MSTLQDTREQLGELMREVRKLTERIEKLESKNLKARSYTRGPYDTSVKRTRTKSK